MTVSSHATAPAVEPATAEWWMFLVWGIAGLAVGGMLLLQPVASALVLVTTVAVLWVIGGVVDIVGALVLRTGRWGWHVAGGVLSVLVGSFVLAHPFLGTFAAVSVLYLVIALVALVNGVLGLFEGSPHAVGRVLLSALQIVLACLMLVGFLDLVSLRVLVQAVGLVAIGGGIGAAVTGLQWRPRATTTV